MTNATKIKRMYEIDNNLPRALIINVMKSIATYETR